MLNRIETMLNNDIPVCLLIDSLGNSGVNFKDDKSTTSDPYNYQINKYPYLVKHHFVTITGLLKDNVKNQTILKISSWGKEYYIDYDQLITFIKMIAVDYYVIL